MLADREIHGKFAEELATATKEAVPVDPLSTRAELDVEDAYAIQRLVASRWLDEGDEVVGRKIGLTSNAMQSQMGVREPDYGLIWASWQVPAGGQVELNELVSPRLEVEVAALVSKPLQGERIGLTDVLRAVEAWAPAIEVVDSRVADWQITIVDTIADHASGARFVLGTPRRADLLDVGSVGALLLGDRGEVLATGNGRAVLGHPVAAVAWLARALARVGDEIPAGSVVLSGAMHASVALQSAHRFEARLRGLGSVSLEVGGLS